LSPHAFPGSPFGLAGGNALISGGLWSQIGRSYNFGPPVARRFSAIDLFN
jgi:hypothetical protein